MDTIHNVISWFKDHSYRTSIRNHLAIWSVWTIHNVVFVFLIKHILEFNVQIKAKEFWWIWKWWHVLFLFFNLGDECDNVFKFLTGPPSDLYNLSYKIMKNYERIQTLWIHLPLHMQFSQIFGPLYFFFLIEKFPES